MDPWQGEPVAGLGSLLVVQHGCHVAFLEGRLRWGVGGWRGGQGQARQGTDATPRESPCTLGEESLKVSEGRVCISERPLCWLVGKLA